MNKELSFLQQVPMFSGLNEESLQLLLGRSRKLKFRKAAALLTEGETGESLYVIVKGKVKIFVSDEDGNEMTLFIEGPGSYIGEISLLDNEPRTASAVTLEACEIISISKAGFQEVIAENPEIAFEVIKELTRKMRRATEVTRSLALRNVYQRLTLKLRELSEDRDGVKVITIKYSHAELGNMVGASREMVGKIMAALIRGEYVKVVDKKFVLVRDFPHDW